MGFIVWCTSLFCYFYTLSITLVLLILHFHILNFREYFWVIVLFFLWINIVMTNIYFIRQFLWGLENIRVLLFKKVLITRIILHYKWNIRFRKLSSWVVRMHDCLVCRCKHYLRLWNIAFVHLNFTLLNFWTLIWAFFVLFLLLFLVWVQNLDIIFSKCTLRFPSLIVRCTAASLISH